MRVRGRDRAIRRALGGLLAATSLACAIQAGAHTRSASYSSWVLDSEGATVTLRIPQIELTRLPWGYVRGVYLDPNLAAYII